MTCSLLVVSTISFSQVIKLKPENLEAVDVSMSTEKFMGKEVLKVIKSPAITKVDEPTFVKVKDSDFKNGTIEVKVLSRLTKDAPEFARGFIGVAFRIDSSNSGYESIYIRPTNGRADDQVRRNHSTQYYSYPNYKFDRLRQEAPERYESYADMTLNEWITMRVVVSGQRAELYLNNTSEPSLIVNDLKLGPNASGSIALWVEIGTEGYFRDLKVIKHD